MEYFSVPFPINLAAPRDPSASTFPNPFLWAIISIRFRFVSASSHFNLIPEVSSVVSNPRSKHSTAHDKVTPVEIVSSPKALQRWLQQATSVISPTPKLEPNRPILSYSGPPYSLVTLKTPFSPSTDRLQ